MGREGEVGGSRAVGERKANKGEGELHPPSPPRGRPLFPITKVTNDKTTSRGYVSAGKKRGGAAERRHASALADITREDAFTDSDLQRWQGRN